MRCYVAVAVLALFVVAAYADTQPIEEESGELGSGRFFLLSAWEWVVNHHIWVVVVNYMSWFQLFGNWASPFRRVPAMFLSTTIEGLWAVVQMSLWEDLVVSWAALVAVGHLSFLCVPTVTSTQTQIPFFSLHFVLIWALSWGWLRALGSKTLELSCASGASGSNIESVYVSVGCFSGYYYSLSRGVFFKCGFHYFGQFYPCRVKSGFRIKSFIFTHFKPSFFSRLRFINLRY